MKIFDNLSFRRCKKYFIKDAGIVAKALYDYCRITKAGCNACKIENQCKAFIESIPYLRFAIVDAISPKNDKGNKPLGTSAPKKPKVIIDPVKDSMVGALYANGKKIIPHTAETAITALSNGKTLKDNDGNKFEWGWRHGKIGIQIFNKVDTPIYFLEFSNLHEEL